VGSLAKVYNLQAAMSDGTTTVHMQSYGIGSAVFENLSHLDDGFNIGCLVIETDLATNTTHDK
jgi:hypothetical protein